MTLFLEGAFNSTRPWAGHGTFFTDRAVLHRTAQDGALVNDVEQGAAMVRLVTLDDDGPTAGFFGEEGHLPW